MSTIQRRPADQGGVSRDGAADTYFPARLPTVLRPHPRLLKYYVLTSCLAGPFFFFPLLPLYFKYRSLRYEVDEEGIAMRWGILFRREVSLTYARIQDIQLTSNFVERWLGLARIQVQTASGSASAEMTVEGVPEFNAMRDFLYSRMRGARGDAGGGGVTARSHAGTDRAAALPGETAVLDDLTVTLREIAAELRALRFELGDGRSNRSGG